MLTIAVDLFYFLYLLSCTDLDRFVRECIIVVYACTPILVYSYYTQTHLHIYTHIIIYSYKYCNGNILATVHIYIYDRDRYALFCDTARNYYLDFHAPLSLHTHS